MSDTTTITVEKRKMFREDASFVVAHEKKNLERVGAAEAILLLLNALEQAEAMVDWLADKLTTESQNCRDLWRGPEGVERTSLYVTRKEAADAFVEAARRAVAAGESEVEA